MLNIYVGSLPGEVKYIDPYFDFNYEPEWITNELSKKMISDIDNSEVITENVIQNKDIGTIPPQWLSGGVKTLICMWNDNSGENIYNLTGCGDNCADWVLEIGKRKDITVTTHHYFSFGINKPLEIKFLNTGKIVHNSEEYLYEYCEITKDM